MAVLVPRTNADDRVQRVYQLKEGFKIDHFVTSAHIRAVVAKAKKVGLQELYALICDFCPGSQRGIAANNYFDGAYF